MDASLSSDGRPQPGPRDDAFFFLCVLRIASIVFGARAVSVSPFWTKKIDLPIRLLIGCNPPIDRWPSEGQPKINQRSPLEVVPALAVRMPPLFCLDFTCSFIRTGAGHQFLPRRAGFSLARKGIYCGSLSLWDGDVLVWRPLSPVPATMTVFYENFPNCIGLVSASVTTWPLLYRQRAKPTPEIESREKGSRAR